jgi:hypothetical protein
MEPGVLLNTQVGLLAVFQSEDLATASAWRRAPDGTWVEVVLPLEAGDGVADALPGAGDAYLSVLREGRVSILVSEDLQTWSAPPIPDLGYFGGLAMHGDRTVIVGGTGDADGGIGEPRVYVSTQRWVGAPSPS